MSIDKTTEKTSSICVSRTSKGIYSWDIKLYFDKDTESANEVIREINRLDTTLKNSFVGGLK